MSSLHVMVPDAFAISSMASITLTHLLLLTLQELVAKSKDGWMKRYGPISRDLFPKNHSSHMHRQQQRMHNQPKEDEKEHAHRDKSLERFMRQESQELRGKLGLFTLIRGGAELQRQYPSVNENYEELCENPLCLAKYACCFVLYVVYLLLLNIEWRNYADLLTDALMMVLMLVMLSPDPIRC